VAETLEWILDTARFSAIAADWDRLAAGETTPFLLSSWLLLWWRTLAGPRGLRIAALWRHGELVAGLPLKDGARRWESPVRFDVPPLAQMLAADDAARQRLAAEVIASVRGELQLRALPDDDRTLESLLTAVAGTRCRTAIEPMSTVLVTETTGSFEDYRAGLSSKVRSEVGRLRRKAEREHAFELTAIEAPHDLDAQWSRALELEASGWKGRNGSALLDRPEIRAFFDGLIQEFHAAGALRISELSLDGKLAAVALSIVHRQRLFTLKVAYDEEHRRLGLGFVLLMAMIERCFELGLEAYEFSGPEEEYERRFATGERGRCLLRVYSPGVIAGSRYVFRQKVRPMLRDARAATLRGSGQGQRGEQPRVV
jgi:CelD/BcsL family acetyltransferase involved in cellulose biosynthesis